MRVIPEDIEDPPLEIRQRWMQQIEGTLSKLHSKRIVWGDVKSENVLIDGEWNAWVTDFGGGYTVGWVERELAETVEGIWWLWKRLGTCYFLGEYL